MKNILSKKEYETLLRCIVVSEFVYGLMGDFCDDKYKKVSENIDELANKVLKFAPDFKMEDCVEKFDGKTLTSEKLSDKYYPDIQEYEDYSFWSELSTHLAMEQMVKDIGLEKLKSMDKFDFIKLRLDYEEAIDKVLDKHGLDSIALTKTIVPPQAV